VNTFFKITMLYQYLISYSSNK